MKSKLLILALLTISMHCMAQQYVSFEMRYFTADPKANGETDFHGETEWMTLEQRVDFLNKYATYASKFWNDIHFDRMLLKEGETSEILKRIKPKPLTAIRRTIPLAAWKAYGYKNDHDNIKREALEEWGSGNPGVSVKSGQLVLENTTLSRETEPLNWRFRLKMNLQPVRQACSIAWMDNDHQCIYLQFDQGRVLVNGIPSTGMQYRTNEAISLEVYGDFVHKRFFVTVNDHTSPASYPLPEDITGINRLDMGTTGELIIDDILLFNFTKDESNLHTPYYSTVIIDEDF